MNKADEKSKKVAKAGQQSLNVAQGADMFMNQTFVPNNPSIVDNKVWAETANFKNTQC